MYGQTIVVVPTLLLSKRLNVSMIKCFLQHLYEKTHRANTQICPDSCYLRTDTSYFIRFNNSTIEQLNIRPTHFTA